MAQPQARRATALLALLTSGIIGCGDAPTDPAQAGVAPAAAVQQLTSQVFQSGANVTAWDPIAETVQPANYQAAYCTATPKYGVGANWQNPHNAYVLGGHPWAYDAFYAPWINAWNYLGSNGGNPASPNYNWTKYETQVSGTGSFVIHLMADNCSWIYLDGTLVGVQGDTRSTTAYGLTLNGTHTLTFVIFDGGGLAGGKFLLETTTNPPPPLNNDLDADGHVNDQDAFPLDPSEWADTDHDGVGDNGDAFPADATEWKDSDGDGVGDNADAYPNDPTRTSFDADSDGMVDVADNCPAVANASQADLDADGVGDACDPDVDGDGVVNASDAYPSNPAEWADSDGDGIGDNADAYDHSNTGPTIVVVACNSGAPNWRVDGGTWANDLVAAAYASAGTHGQFVSAVSSLADGWKKAGRITGRDQGAIVSCAARTK